MKVSAFIVFTSLSIGYSRKFACCLGESAATTLVKLCASEEVSKNEAAIFNENGPRFKLTGAFPVNFLVTSALSNFFCSLSARYEGYDLAKKS